MGSNVGAFALWALHQWHTAKVICYEPNPDTFKLLEQNVEGMNVEAHKAGVWLAEGKAHLFQPKDGYPPGSWSMKDTGEVDLSKRGICKVVHAANLPACDVLKIDAEGVELDILKAYPHLGTAKAVVLEWHSHADRIAIRDLMAARGFELVQDTEHHWSGRGVQKFVRRPVVTLFVAILAGGGKSWDEFNTCLDQLKVVAPQHGVNLIIGRNSGTGVDRARNVLVAHALETAFTHLLWLDNDVTFNPEDIVKMIASDLDVVGAAYPRKQIEWEQVEAAVKSGVPASDLKYYATSHIYNHVVNNEGGNNARSFPNLGDFVEVEEIGTGFLLIKRSVIEKMLEAYRDEMAYITDYPPRGVVHHTMFLCQRDPMCEVEAAKRELMAAAKECFSDSQKVESFGRFNAAGSRYAKAIAQGTQALGRMKTEDYAWCTLWRMLGGQVYLYVNADVGHIGPLKFEGQIRRLLQKVGSQEGVGEKS